MAIALLVVCLLLTACADDPEPEPTPPPTPTAAATPTPTATPAPTPSPAAPACANQDAVVSDSSLRTGESASGDVDGDGVEDSVSIHFDPAGPDGCQAFVVAESDGGTVAGPLETWREDFGLPMPTINTLTDVDGEPGDEVVVNMGAGASTQFVGLVSASGESLVQVMPEGLPDQAAQGMFGFGGSVGHLEAVDCARFGGVVSSFAIPRGNRYRVERRYLVFRGDDLQFSHVEVERVAPDLIDRLPEYSASPFGSCGSY